MPGNPFWKTKTLKEMTVEEWESLCDGCALCCLYKLQDDETEETYYTDVACRLLNLKKCQCKAYTERAVLMPTCLVLTPHLLNELTWMPSTCAYRLLHEGRELPWWHPLVSGDKDLVHRLHLSIRGRAVSEKFVDMDTLEDHIVDWFSEE
jgi:uncharacterized protein